MRSDIAFLNDLEADLVSAGRRELAYSKVGGRHRPSRRVVVALAAATLMLAGVVCPGQAPKRNSR